MLYYPHRPVAPTPAVALRSKVCGSDLALCGPECFGCGLTRRAPVPRRV